MANGQWPLASGHWPLANIGFGTEKQLYELHSLIIINIAAADADDREFGYIEILNLFPMIINIIKVEPFFRRRAATSQASRRRSSAPQHFDTHVERNVFITFLWQLWFFIFNPSTLFSCFTSTVEVVRTSFRPQKLKIYQKKYQKKLTKIRNRDGPLVDSIAICQRVLVWRETFFVS